MGSRLASVLDLIQERPRAEAQHSASDPNTTVNPRPKQDILPQVSVWHSSSNQSTAFRLKPRYDIGLHVEGCCTRETMMGFNDISEGRSCSSKFSSRDQVHGMTISFRKNLSRKIILSSPSSPLYPSLACLPARPVPPIC